ncbi:MAG TPA: glycosyltransferase [Rectinemataceae bacterium]|nr:glycosyltransferase [Rectinemataceae bacterium]
MSPRVYFFLRPQGAPEAAGYQHCLVALAEGLEELGIPFGANRDYWKEDGRVLFRRDEALRPEDCEVLMTSDEYTGSGGEMPASLLDGRRRTVYVDSSDGWRTRAEAPEYRRFDLVLRTHYNRRYRYPGNVKPWAFGLTRRIIGACGGAGGSVPGFAGREPRVLVNFRVGHPVRQAAELLLAPALAERFAIDRSVDEPPASGPDRGLWEATGRRHYPSFYARLVSSRACAAFGGYFAPGLFGSTEALPERALYAAFWRLGRRTRTVMQFDSWRFWESLAAGCLTLHVDLAAYGCALPVEPRPGEEYLGFDFDRRDCAAPLRESSDEELGRIAAAGRSWALEHYSPRAQAARLLQLLDAEAFGLRHLR